jgi:hypothetical protein
LKVASLKLKVKLDEKFEVHKIHYAISPLVCRMCPLQCNFAQLSLHQNSKQTVQGMLKQQSLKKGSLGSGWQYSGRLNRQK